MSAERRVRGRLYFFEIATLANFVLLAIAAHLRSFQYFGMLPQLFLSVMLSSIVSVLAGITVRSVVAWWKGTWRQYRSVITSAGWLSDTGRMLLGEVLLTQVYGWIKLVIPLYRGRLFDEALWEVDRALCFGMSPSIFLLTLFSNSFFLRFIDWAYANIFLLTIFIAFGYFLSAPSRRLRVAFMTSNVVMWLTGVYLYFIFPSLGPAFRFPEVWVEYAKQLTTTQRLQSALSINYSNVLATARGENRPVSILYGVAAFPSLHVGWQALVALWMHRRWIYGEIFFWISLFTIFVGSIITGWHYLIDSIAGLALAFVSYYSVARAMRIGRWQELTITAGER